MTSKRIIYLFMTAGSVIGGAIPGIFGRSSFGMISVFAVAIGGLIGIWIGFKMTR